MKKYLLIDDEADFTPVAIGDSVETLLENHWENDIYFADRERFLEKWSIRYSIEELVYYKEDK